ncbi:hypothetical protein PO909_030232 [Leuciscus waleckii]
MNVHVFGNSPSPAVAIHGLHKSVQGNEFHIDPDVQHFVLHDFYVDDGLKRYTETSPSAAVRRELCVFCDASVKAIGAVCYLKVTDSNGNNQIGFVMGKAKLAPCPEHTVPRLELCTAVLAVELADLVNRVLRIRRSCRPDQWRYVPTDLNPADHATRSVPAGQLKHTNWLSGPKFLSKPELSISACTYDLVDPSTDPDIRPLVSAALSTTASNKQLDSQRFAKFSTWKSLTRAVTCLVHIACHFKTAHRENRACKGWHYCKAEFTVEESEKASTVIIQAVQQEVYSQEIKCILKQERMPKTSPLRNLDSFIDAHGLLRVGGRLHHSSLDQSEKTPLIIPGQHHIARPSDTTSSDTTTSKSIIKAVTLLRGRSVQLAFG